MNLLDQLTTARNTWNAILAEFQKNGTALMQELSAPIFQQYPDLEAFRWTQYTPYFNDGEPCVFNAHIDYLDLKMDGKWLEDCPSYKRKDPGPVDLEAQAVGELLSAIGGDGLEAVFGDHVKITVYRSGKTKVDEYEHD